MIDDAAPQILPQVKACEGRQLATLGKKRKAPAPPSEDTTMQDRKPIELETGWSFMQVCTAVVSYSKAFYGWTMLLTDVVMPHRKG